ncbi:hypothetical protein D3C80_1582800 [compost metagenome]
MGFLDSVRAHQHLVADLQAHVNDIIGLGAWTFCLGRYFAIAHRCHDGPVQAALVELEGFFAVTVEDQVGIESHGGLRDIAGSGFGLPGLHFGSHSFFLFA